MFRTTGLRGGLEYARSIMDAKRELALPWRHRIHPLYALSLLGFVTVLATIASRSGQFQPVHRATMGAAAVLLFYSLLVQVVNATRMTILGSSLRLAHGPLPWRGSAEVPLEAIRTLRCDPHSRRLILRTKLGEELVLAENLPASELVTIDGWIRTSLVVDQAA